MNRILKLITGLLTVALLINCSDSSTEPGTPVEEQLANHFDEQLDAWGPTYAAPTLYGDIQADEAPAILSVRATADYNTAHILGAENIPWRQVTDQSALDAAGLSMDEQVVAYCYTGHTGQVAATIMKMMGYDAVNLKFGMMSWASDAANGGTDGGVAPFDYQNDPPNSGTAGIETTVNDLSASGTYELPALDVASGDMEEMVREAANLWLADDTPITSATALYDNLNDGDTSNDPVILSVRGTAHYEAGHITGAYNIPWREIANVDNLTKLDPDAEYVVYCYTGHTGQVAATVMKMLGYNVKNLKYGMMGWTSNETYMQGVSVFDPADVINDMSVVE